jgi:hypothetical protein
MKANQQNRYSPVSDRGAAPEQPVFVNAHSEEEAIEIFWRATDRLLDVNHWSGLCGPLPPLFRLTDNQGAPLVGKAAPGNHIRVGNPGPAIDGGETAGWLRVEKIEHHAISASYELFVLQMKSFPNPIQDASARNSSLPKDTPTSSLIIERDRQYISATIYSPPGPSDIPYDSNSPGGSRGQRTSTEEPVPDITGVSRHQWYVLSNALLKR